MPSARAAPSTLRLLGASAVGTTGSSRASCACDVGQPRWQLGPAWRCGPASAPLRCSSGQLSGLRR
eukprot:10149278-Lingulodinium_polyedra.AAC.1